MTPLISPETMQKNLAEVTRQFATLRGEFNALESRKLELEKSVGLAKGRLERKKNVEQFFEEMQAEAHAKRVGDFERLLTALVTEVLPNEKPIGFELDIERGQTGLDIVSRISADLSEDIFEDQGGALTNIVVLGLRMIAVVRSGMRRFLVLDEPDCWIKDERVPDFYGVVKDASRKLGMQCFVISHHNTAKFAEGISVSRVHGHPENPNGVLVENNAKRYAWKDDEDGFRYIRLINFQGYIDETLHLTNGVNALIGDNNIGKSSFVRALRAVFYGDIRDKLVRRGQDSCTVEIGLRDGVILQWTRQRKKNSRWRLLLSDRTVVSDQFDTAQRTPPEWILKTIGIGPVEGLDPHIVKQKLPIFLLDKPSSVRASVLSIGQESNHIREMIKTYKKMCEQDNATVKSGEQEMSRLLHRKALLDLLLADEAVIERAEALAEESARLMTDSRNAERLIQQIDAQAAQVMRLRNMLSILEEVPDAADFDQAERNLRRGVGEEKLVSVIEKTQQSITLARQRLSVLETLPTSVPEITLSNELMALGKAVKDKMVANDLIREKLRVLSQLPDGAPQLADNKDAEKMIANIERVMRMTAETRQHKLTCETNIARIEKQIEDLVEDMDHTCPTCGGHVEDAAVLIGGKHKHKADHQHA